MTPPAATPNTVRSPAIFGGDFHAVNLDLVLASLVALGLPFAASWLYTVTGGATASLILYYVVCCVILVLWRKRTLDYHRPARWPWLLLTLSLLLPLGAAALNRGALPNAHAPLWGLLVTALVWAPMTAALEQLSWFYVFDAWRNRWRVGQLRWVGLAVGALLLITLVALIHILFWARFLPVATNAPTSALTPILNLVLTIVYGALYYRKGARKPPAFKRGMNGPSLAGFAPVRQNRDTWTSRQCARPSSTNSSLHPNRSRQWSLSYVAAANSTTPPCKNAKKPGKSAALV